MENINSVTVIGAGVIGSGWVARLLLNGIDVSVYDPSPNAASKIEIVLGNARRATSQLIDCILPTEGKYTLEPSISQAVAQAELVIEAIPENLSAKQAVFKEVESSVSDHVIITSSTSGILPTDMQSDMKRPERLLVVHPFNPVYLLPLVELVGGEKTSVENIQNSSEFFRRLGMFPLHVRKEIPAFIADRFLETVWREALWLVNDGIATTAEIDDAIRYGFGLRWAQMGLFETYRLAGGEGGMRHFIEQFGPCLKWPWTHLTDVPEFTEELIDKVASQSDTQSGEYTIPELERIRDDNLVGIMQSLKENRWGAGNPWLDYEKQLKQQIVPRDFEQIDFSQPVKTFNQNVPQKWTDYNGHMNESRYLECFSNATDAFMEMIGIDENYISQGGSYFTVETHIRHIDEVTAGEMVYITTQLLNGQGKKLQLFHQLYHESGRLLASGEHMLIHVNLDTRQACDPGDVVTERLQKINLLHSKIDIPDGVGRAIADKV